MRTESHHYHDASSATVEIRNRGRWRPRRDLEPGCGRGLSLMRAGVAEMNLRVPPEGNMVCCGSG
jgi:hypothetical protein